MRQAARLEPFVASSAGADPKELDGRKRQHDTSEGEQQKGQAGEGQNPIDMGSHSVAARPEWHDSGRRGSPKVSNSSALLGPTNEVKKRPREGVQN
jgi:hypothetical protein